jgi:hypothetical protein
MKKSWRTRATRGRKRILIPKTHSVVDDDLISEVSTGFQVARSESHENLTRLGYVLKDLVIGGGLDDDLFFRHGNVA